MKPINVYGIAFLWGLMEATLFYIVPDVWLTAIALSHPRRALRACLLAVAGALIGGAIMFAWAVHTPEKAINTVQRVPAISPQMMQSVDSDMRVHGVSAMFMGMITGTPYKVYAVTAAMQDRPLSRFLLVSIPARLLRFVALTLFAAGIARGLSRWLGLRRLILIHVSVWMVFYSLFFILMPN